MGVAYCGIRLTENRAQVKYVQVKWSDGEVTWETSSSLQTLKYRSLATKEMWRAHVRAMAESAEAQFVKWANSGTLPPAANSKERFKTEPKEEKPDGMDQS
ncbi:hypothetical protein TWF481_002799 [Arthrobotrys musiformis]|uniref:Chromo domain-containing protein n=1 Tax=Arthrobotrys musiformis TaxID=47236 RepID=A0AAV9VSH6_9PEZI